MRNAFYRAIGSRIAHHCVDVSEIARIRVNRYGVTVIMTGIHREDGRMIHAPRTVSLSRDGGAWIATVCEDGDNGRYLEERFTGSAEKYLANLDYRFAQIAR